MVEFIHPSDLIGAELSGVGLQVRQAAIATYKPSVNPQAASVIKTKWSSYLQDSAMFISVLAKRTGRLKPLGHYELILKILNSFIRCNQQISGQTRKRPVTGLVFDQAWREPLGHGMTVEVNDKMVEGRLRTKLNTYRKQRGYISRISSHY